MAKAEIELREEFERYGDRENWSAWLIVAALVMEAYAAWHFSTPDKLWYETAFLIIANLAIAAGVYGEIRFGRKADAVAEQLKQISDEKIAASEKAAEEARFETERLREKLAWRELTPAQAAKLTAGLSAQQQKINVFTVGDDPERREYAAMFVAALSSAGLLDSHANLETSPQPPSPGLTVSSPYEPSIALVVSALEQAGLAASTSRSVMGGVCLWVGPKPRPQLGIL